MMLECAQLLELVITGVKIGPVHFISGKGIKMSYRTN